MILRHETTPGYARLHRRRRRQHWMSGQVLSAALGAVLLTAIALSLLIRSDPATTMGLGAALLLYAVASFGFERPPRRATRGTSRAGMADPRRRAPTDRTRRP